MFLTRRETTGLAASQDLPQLSEADDQCAVGYFVHVYVSRVTRQPQSILPL